MQKYIHNSSSFKMGYKTNTKQITASLSTWHPSLLTEGEEVPSFHLTSDHKDVFFVFVFGGLSQRLEAHQHLDVALYCKVAREVCLQGGQSAFEDSHQVLLADDHCHVRGNLGQVTLDHLAHS